MLQSRNVTHYPASCASATASFAVLSQTIRHIRTQLPPSLQDLVTELQRLEQVKLQQTAALHLERIRGDEEIDTVTKKLLSEGVQRLSREIHETEAGINDVMEELRCARVDLSLDSS